MKMLMLGNPTVGIAVDQAGAVLEHEGKDATQDTGNMIKVLMWVILDNGADDEVEKAKTLGEQPKSANCELIVAPQ